MSPLASYDYAGVIAHELGHVLYLDHTRNPHSIMYHPNDLGVSEPLSKVWPDHPQSTEYDPGITAADYVRIREQLGRTPAAATTTATGRTPWGSVTEREREALVALYHATDGPNWADRTNWLSDRPVGEWYGVTVTDTAVTGLSLNGLGGVLPRKLGNLTNLEH